MQSFDYDLSATAAIRANLAGDTDALRYLWNNAPDGYIMFATLTDWIGDKLVHDYHGDTRRALNTFDDTMAAVA